MIKKKKQPREEEICEITDKSGYQKVTLFACINLGTKLNPNKARS
jgi:hypothetical protein